MSANGSISVITSADYINTELSAEYGRIPPSFLPFGHRRLYEEQVKYLKEIDSKIVLTLPESYQPMPWDVKWLKDSGVEILFLPDDLSLAESILHTLTHFDCRGAVNLLHGDTLFLGEWTYEHDRIGIAPTQNAYNWGELDHWLKEGGQKFGVAKVKHHVMAGWFTFSNGPDLIRCLIKARGDFLQSLELYNENRSLALQKMPEWLDFGHLQTFYSARTKVSIARSFNSLTVSDKYVIKSGDNIDKLAAEADWFSSLPHIMRLHTPVFLGKEDVGYRLSYESSPTLHELYIFGTIDERIWERILDNCFSFMEQCSEFSDEQDQRKADAISSLSGKKTLKRIRQLKSMSKLEIDFDKSWVINGKAVPSLIEIVDYTNVLISKLEKIPGIMHGDFCFPNIFFDFRKGIIKVIDPRGSIDDINSTVFGDICYDLAKLNHSIEGYDAILANRYHMTYYERNNIDFQLAHQGAKEFLPQMASQFHIKGQKISDSGIKALTIQLFLSMLPLHNDRPDRQQAFLGNALRLFSELEAPM